MASEHSAEDRTEEPTARRLQTAREDGEAARSVEAPAAAVVISAAAVLVLWGGDIGSRLKALFAVGFVVDRKALSSVEMIPAILADQLGQAFLIIAPLMIATVLAAVIGSGITGGYLFSMKSVGPNFNKLNPFAGLARIFGTKALVELLKTVSKFLLVFGIVAWIIDDKIVSLIGLGNVSLESALGAAGDILVHATLTMALSLLVIAAFDSFYQQYKFSERMRMTKQEIRDEMKQMEGQPEIKAEIRRRQREMSSSRMIERIKDADVVITNPEHFAVALAYDPAGDGAPVLVAKGLDEVAFRMMDEAKKCGVHVFQAPPLARALYFTTKVGQTIPDKLFYATAQVIAYVFSLNSFNPTKAQPLPPAVEVPDDMIFDGNGVHENADREVA
jgi:flagellar biosynthetic protein FlhB